jgi:hypothetical protein
MTRVKANAPVSPVAIPIDVKTSPCVCHIIQPGIGV